MVAIKTPFLLSNERGKEFEKAIGSFYQPLNSLFNKRWELSFRKPFYEPFD